MFPLKDNIPLARFPLATVALVAINVVAYLLSIRHGGSFFGGPSDSVVTRYGAIPFELTHSARHCDLAPALIGYSAPIKTLVACPPSPTLLGPVVPVGGQPASWQTVLSSLFLHGSFVSLLADLLALALFGPNVEDATGRLRFLCFYLFSGMLALGVLVLVAPRSPIPVLAASAPVAAVLGAYLLLFPRARVVALAPIPLFATIVELPAVALLGLWLLAQLWFALAGLSGPNGGWIGIADLARPLHSHWAFAFAAAAAGALAGAVLIRLFVSAARSAAKGQRTPPQPVY
jgi:membrane associated rhomboid family serine protease